jgi:hypothetical protein
MMRKSLPTLARRAAISSVVAMAISGATVVSPAVTAAHAATTPEAQLTALLQMQTGDNTATTDKQVLPSPPKPKQTRPTQRVMASGTSTATTNATVTAAATVNPVGKSGTGAPGAGTGKTLVLYDNTGPYSWLGEVYGIQTVNLVSHFNAWTAHPVGQYTAGELNASRTTVTMPSCTGGAQRRVRCNMSSSRALVVPGHHGSNSSPPPGAQVHSM